MVIGNKGSRPLYWLMAEDIIAKIASGAWKPGDRLPSERALCEQYQVSQITVRRALRELAHSGRVYSRHGLGWFVDDEQRPEMAGRHIAIILEEIDPLLLPVIRVLSERLGARGIAVDLIFEPDAPERRAQAVERALAQGAEMALAVVEGDEQGAAQRYRSLAEQRAPMLLLLRDIPSVDLPAIALDEALCMEHLTRHLLTLGHTRLAYVGGNPATMAGWRRYRGFSSTLWSEGLELPLDWVFAVSLGEKREAARFRDALQGQVRPTAIVCASDARAGEAMALLRQMNLQCPRDVAVVGLGDSPFDLWLPSPLTVFRFDADGLAQQTLWLTQERLAGRAVESVRLSGQLIVRESCGAALQPASR